MILKDLEMNSIVIQRLGFSVCSAATLFNLMEIYGAWKNWNSENADLKLLCNWNLALSKN